MKKVIVLCLLILLSVCACRQQKGDTNKVEESGKNQQKKIISKVQRKALEKQKERRKEEQKELKKTQKNQFKIKGNKLIKFYWREAPKEHLRQKKVVVIKDIIQLIYIFRRMWFLKMVRFRVWDLLPLRLKKEELISENHFTIVPVRDIRYICICQTA